MSHCKTKGTGSSSVADLPHQFRNTDLDPHYSQNSGAVDAHNRAMKGREGSQQSHGGSVDQWLLISITSTRSRSRIRICAIVKILDQDPHPSGKDP